MKINTMLYACLGSPSGACYSLVKRCSSDRIKLLTTSRTYKAVIVAATVALCSCSDGDRKPSTTKTPSDTSQTSTSTNSKEVSTEVGKPITVGVLYWSMNIPGQVAMRKGLEQILLSLNLAREIEKLPKIVLKPFVAGNGDEGIENQVRQMNALVEDSVDLIIAQPTDTAALTNALRAANSKGIPVIAYDQQILNGELASFITSDNYQAGYLDGEYVAAKFPDSKKLKIIVVEYPQVSSTVSRVDGFIDALQENDQAYKVVKSYSAVEPVAGTAAGKAILADYPNPGSIDVVFTVNDGGGLSVFNELRTAGRTEIFGATVDGDPSSVEMIRRGDLIKIDSAQFCGALGATALLTADKLLRGQSVSKELLVPTFPITRDTENMYNGWTGATPDAFTKPWESKSPSWSPEIREPKKATRD